MFKHRRKTCFQGEKNAWQVSNFLASKWKSPHSKLSLVRTNQKELAESQIHGQRPLKIKRRRVWKANSLEKTLKLVKTKGKRIMGWQRRRWLDGINDSMDMSLSKLRVWWWTGKPGVLQSMGSQRVRHNWVAELTDWLNPLTGLLCSCL